MRAVRLGVVFVALQAQAAIHDHVHQEEAARARDPQIVVTINPEARVSAMVGSPMPPPVKCGEAIELSLQIVNDGFVTAPLRAAFVDERTSRVALRMDAAKLSGAPREARILHLVPLTNNPTDVTIAFGLGHEIGDLGGRDRVHLLVRCI